MIPKHSGKLMFIGAILNSSKPDYLFFNLPERLKNSLS